MNYTKLIKDAEKYWVYVSDRKGKAEGFFAPIEEVPVIKQLIADYSLIKGWLEALGLISQEEMKKLSLPNSTALHGNLKRLFDNSDLIINGQETHAFEFNGEYISKFMKIDKVYHGGVPKDILNGYYKMVNGKLVVDEEKKAEYLANIGG